MTTRCGACLFALTVLVAGCSSGARPRSVAPSTTSSTSLSVTSARSAQEPVLGRSRSPYQRGYGKIRPTSIDNGGDPTGIVEHVRWRSWGGDRAVGNGVGYYQPPGKIVADSVAEPATVIAFNLGTCRGLRAYNAIWWYYPQHGEKFDPSRYINICTGQYVGSP